MTGNLKKIYSRKKETKYITLIKLDKKYKEFLKKKKIKFLSIASQKKKINYEKINFKN